ncbi:hypothetical protein M9458_017894, partial [Cirrhinus mrigala]
KRAFRLWQLKLNHAHSHLHHICCWRNTRHLRLHLSVWKEKLAERKRARLAVFRNQKNIMWRMRNTFLQRFRSRDHWTQTQQR